MTKQIDGATITGAPNLPTPLSPDLGGNVGSGGKQWRITIDNSAGTETVKTIIGDFTSALSKYKQIPTSGAGALDVSITDGNFGQDTLPIMKLWTGVHPVAIKGMHVQADDASFFAQGKISALLADIENQAPREKVLNFATDVTGETFNQNVRQKPTWKFLLSGRGGIYVEVPAGRKITITLGLVAQADAHLFLEV